MTALVIPGHMAHLPRDAHGNPVPWISSWEHETWSAIRHDPLVGRVAIFTASRPGRGRPVIGIANEPRQREAVMRGRCQVCAGRLDGGLGWLPDVVIAAGVAGAESTVLADVQVSSEPTCCLGCLSWSIEYCPGLRGTARLLHVRKARPLAQMVDPSRGPGRKAFRFGGDDAAERERLGRIARRHGGAVGYVKLIIDAADEVAA